MSLSKFPEMILRPKGKQFRIGLRSQEKRLLKQMFLAALPELKELRVVSISLYLQRLRTSKKLTKPLKTPPKLEWRKLIELRPQSPREAFTLTVTN